MTIMLTTFMPCSAKLTIIALVSGTFFPHNSWVAPSAYFLGGLAVVCSGIFLKKTKMFSGDHSPFVMELPAYHLPRLDNTLRSVWQRAYAFIYKAGTIIFLSCVLIWFLSSFNFRMQMVDQNHSILRALGAVIAPIFAPLGFGDWHATVAVWRASLPKKTASEPFISPLCPEQVAPVSPNSYVPTTAQWPAILSSPLTCCAPPASPQSGRCTRNLGMPVPLGGPSSIRHQWPIWWPWLFIRVHS